MTIEKKIIQEVEDHASGKEPSRDWQIQRMAFDYLALIKERREKAAKSNGQN